jgi:hypothetical protein
MADHKLLSLAGDLRARAKKVLAQVETMKDEEARRVMREIAEDYELLAQRVERAPPHRLPLCQRLAGGHGYLTLISRTLRTSPAFDSGATPISVGCSSWPECCPTLGAGSP